MQEPQLLENDAHLLTSDLGLASALVTLGYELTAIDKTNRAKARFVFLRHEKIEQDVKKYWDGVLRPSARHLFDNQKMLKSRLYSN
jgi:hypothetical protein